MNPRVRSVVARDDYHTLYDGSLRQSVASTDFGGVICRPRPYGVDYPMGILIRFRRGVGTGVFQQSGSVSVFQWGDL